MKVKRLIECYMNEKNTNAFLKYNQEVVAYFYTKIIDQKNIIKKNPQKSNILKSIYELEIERLEYLIKSYLTIRINKMKRNLFIDENCLSEDEKKFYKILKDQINYKNECNESVDVVGFICKKDIGNVLLDGESVEMNKGDFYIGPLCDVMDLLNQDEIYLV
ncbi:DNA replication complex GINS protein (SLD5) [Vairimorpha necatrix]|uniref:DNA replication complex GINS protein (SLD5) n=1 Tax=Vairimorpha necatrix TaxID=6039 RepID=A0AAX4J917_9MICR